MIFKITSEWEELEGKWIRADCEEQARVYLEEQNCEYTFALSQIQGIPMDEPDFDCTNYLMDL